VHASTPDGEVIAEPGPLDDTFLLWDADLDAEEAVQCCR
jgi:hypothetical protein